MAGEIIDILAQNNFQINYTYCTIVLTVLYIQTGRFCLRAYQFFKKKRGVNVKFLRRIN